MIYAILIALFLLATFIASWLLFFLLSYFLLTISFTLTYFFVWDAEKRKAICPNGFLSALLYFD